ncbi:sulfur carrier protein ThiS [Rothia sp. P5766]|uniref:sulfur carrier protein ThiS n=1 Tax=unclassified Rothia (in: high G+C Gram-positive bacteria) TaxID=2689056 RepID=UPI003ACCCFCE
MNILLNGQPTTLPETATVLTAVEHLHGSSLAQEDTRRGIAIARNQTVIPRSTWQDTPLAEGDTLEVITAVQGG